MAKGGIDCIERLVSIVCCTLALPTKAGRMEILHYIVVFYQERSFASAPSPLPSLESKFELASFSSIVHAVTTE